MAHDVRVVTEAELRGVLTLDRALTDVIEKAFATLAGEGVVMPPVLSMALEAAHGEVDVKTAYLPGFDGFAIKVSPGFFDNPKIGLPSLNGLMILFSAKTGLVQSLFLDNGYLTDLRTAAAGGVAARHLAPAQVDTAAVLGTGVQARLQMEAAHQERPFRRLLVWGRDPAKAARYAEDMGARLGIPVEPVAEIGAAVAQSQLVVTTTPSRSPLITRDMLHPGLHITAMGSDQEGKTEIAPEVLAAVDLYIADRRAQCEVMGELAPAIAAGAIPGRSVELGDVIAGAAQGRGADSDVTLCDLTGTGAQDTAIASHVAGLLDQTAVGSVIRA
ncbi:cyclodeaminase [Pseudooceanicola sp.]|uniref:cyclodeaminase n=1 Tax=Pseudooceanicola sp. TaxID=1914328 RepID=UPI0035C6DA67